MLDVYQKIHEQRKRQQAKAIIDFDKYQAEVLWWENFRNIHPQTYFIIQRLKSSLEKIESMKIISDVNVADQMKRTILQNIRKLKKDPGYIPQARAINEQIQTLINMKKVDVEVMRLSNPITYPLTSPPHEGIAAPEQAK